MKLLDLIPITIIRDSISKIVEVVYAIKRNKAKKKVDKVFDQSGISSDDIDKLLND